MEECCAVCAEPLEWVAYGPCGHKDVCSLCVARLRVVLKDTRCCICKQDCPTVFVTKAVGDYTKSVTNFDELPKLVAQSKGGDSSLGVLVYYEDIQGYFDDQDHFGTIRSMCKLSCSRCEKQDFGSSTTFPKGAVRQGFVFKDIGQLRFHLDKVHKLTTCDLCLQGRKVFVVEQKLYTRNQLEQHQSKGNSEVDGTAEERGGFKGHPLCSFCNRRFYGENELYQHMSQEHFTCHICQRQNPGQYQYYANYIDLEAHFGHEHFLCEDPACLEKKFIVFPSEGELKRHNAQTHGGNMSRSQRNAALTLPVSFYFSRPTQDGHGGESSGRGFGRGQGGGRNRGREIVIRPEEVSFPGESTSAGAGSSSSGAQGLSTLSSLEGSDDGSNNNGLQLSDFPGLGGSGSNSLESQRWLSAASGLATNSVLQEAAFPPLPGTSKKARQKAKLRAQAQAARPMNALFGNARGASPSGGVRVLHTSQATRNSSPGADPPSSVPAFERPSTSTTPPPQTPNNPPAPDPPPAPSPTFPMPPSVRTIAHTLRGPWRSNMNVARAPTVASSSASVGADQALDMGRRASVDQIVVVPELGSMEDIRAANKALNKRVKEFFGADEIRFGVFKNLMGRLSKREISGGEYFREVSAMGLGWIIPELARLCPDPQMKRELLEAHAAAGSRPDKEQQSARGGGNAASVGSGSSVAGGSGSPSVRPRRASAVSNGTMAAASGPDEALDPFPSMSAAKGPVSAGKKGKSPATKSDPAEKGKNKKGSSSGGSGSNSSQGSGVAMGDLGDDMGEDESRDSYRGERGKRLIAGKAPVAQSEGEVSVLNSSLGTAFEEGRLSSSSSSPSLSTLGGGSRSMQQSPALHSSSSFPDLTGGLGEGESGEDGWECRICTLRNREAAVRCEACGALAPSGGSGGSSGRGKKKANKVTVRLTSGDGAGVGWGLLGQTNGAPSRPLPQEPPAPSTGFGRGRGFGRGSGPNAWGGRGGQRIVAIAERESIIESAWGRR